MEFNHHINNVRRRVANEDRLSSLPDELIHEILSYFDMKYVVQTCLLSSRWEFIWKSMPCLNLSSNQFRSIPKFANFVTHVLSHRNHEIQVPLIKLAFHGEANQVFAEKIASYAFSHNVQQLTIFNSSKGGHAHPPCVLFSSQSLKHLTLVCNWYCSLKTPPLDFPALTTLNLTYIRLRGDLFSKCVILKNLTLENFYVGGVEVFDIITPRVSNLVLIGGSGVKAINVIAPQLENLTIIDCFINYLNAPPGLSSICYTFRLVWPVARVLQFSSDDRFHSLNKVSISLDAYKSIRPYKKEDAHTIINMLQQLHSARYLTLNTDIVECISLFPDLLSHHPSPFSNLICLTIDNTKKRDDAFEVTISSEVINFLLKNSPSAKIILKLPKVLLISESQNPI